MTGWQSALASGDTPAIVDLASHIASQQAAQSTAPQTGGMATATAEKQ
jgi:hypothetical protein